MTLQLKEIPLVVPPFLLLLLLLFLLNSAGLLAQKFLSFLLPKKCF
jgi:uncharacterized membrane protein YadS